MSDFDGKLEESSNSLIAGNNLYEEGLTIVGEYYGQ